VVLSPQSSAQSKTNTKHTRVQKGRKQGGKPALAGYRKACRGQEIVAPPFAKVSCQRERGAAISCPSLLQRIKIVLFIHLLLNHILYPNPARTPYQAWQAEEKTAAFPCTLCRCLGKRKLSQNSLFKADAYVRSVAKSGFWDCFCIKSPNRI
jgi:hypothetical protein